MKTKSTAQAAAQGGHGPATPGIGQVWFDTQMEKYAGKDKSGAATEMNAQTWKIERKIAAPDIDMNNPHNMWTDRARRSSTRPSGSATCSTCSTARPVR